MDDRMQWKIQPASAFDAGEIEEFTDRAWHDYHVEQGHDLSYDWTRQQVHLIASDEHRIIGVARGRIGAGVGHLSALIVDPGARGLGVGTELLEAFEAQCRDTGCHKLTVMTERDGPAKAFYERRGWQVEAIFRRDRGGNDFVRLMKFTDGAACADREGDSQ